MWTIHRVLAVLRDYRLDTSLVERAWNRTKAANKKQVNPGGQKDSKSDKVYHLVGKGLKLPFWDRVPKNRFLKRYFEKKMNKVARSGAGWDPIALLAKVPIGITSYWRVHSRPNLELATVPGKKKVGRNALPQRGEATARAARNGRHAS